MAIVKVQGSQTPRESDATSLSSLKLELNLENYAATVNGEPQSGDYELGEYDVVHFSEAVKGGNR